MNLGFGVFIIQLTLGLSLLSNNAYCEVPPRPGATKIPTPRKDVITDFHSAERYWRAEKLAILLR